VADTQAASETILNSRDDTGLKISGSFAAAIKFPNLVELTSKLRKLETYWSTFGAGEAFYFHGDGTFEDLILSALLRVAGDAEIGVPLPSWTQSASNFVIDASATCARMKHHKKAGKECKRLVSTYTNDLTTSNSKRYWNPENCLELTILCKPADVELTMTSTILHRIH